MGPSVRLSRNKLRAVVGEGSSGSPVLQPRCRGTRRDLPTWSQRPRGRSEPLEAKEETAPQRSGHRCIEGCGGCPILGGVNGGGTPTWWEGEDAQRDEEEQITGYKIVIVT